MRINKAPQSRKRGFTLTEIAIVLGIMGLILGAVWTAAATVYANQKNAKLDQEVITVVQGLRALYATSLTTGDAAGVNETTPLVNAGIFPADLVSAAGVPMTPWGSTTSIMVTSQTISTAGDALMVELNGVPKAGCVAFLTGQTGTNGLVYANATAAAKGATAVTLTAGSLAIPVTATLASGACAAATNSVQVAYSLKG